MDDPPVTIDPSALGSRILIIGNGGSGKSTLAHALGRDLVLPVFELDDIYWEEPEQKTRDRATAYELVRAIVNRPEWVVEGIYVVLSAIALARATGLVWLDMPWSTCRDGLLKRGASQVALTATSQYWTRENGRARHLSFFTSFKGPKIRIRAIHGRQQFLSSLRTEPSGSAAQACRQASQAS